MIEAKQTTRIERDMPEAEYRAYPAVNKSLLCAISERSPLHARYELENPDDFDTPDLRLGRLVHLAILEPEAFERRVVLGPTVDHRTAAGKAAWKAVLEANPAAEVVGQDIWEAIAGVRLAVRNSPRARTLTACKGCRELSLFWEREGRECKARLDKLAWATPERPVILDIKTTRNAKPDAFARDAIARGYHQQAAWYIDAVEACYGHRAAFVMLAVEKEPPFGVSIHEFSDAAIRAGQAMNSAAWGRLMLAERTGVWPGYGEDINTIDAPAWLLRGLGMESEL